MNTQKIKSNRRLISVMLVGVLIGVLFTTIFVEAQTGTLSTITISGGPYPGAPDYTIFVEDGMYYAKDKYGAISWTSTNAGTILQNITNQFTSTGGNITVSLASGIFDMGSTALTVTPVGYTNATLNIFGQGGRASVIQTANSTNIFTVTSGGGDLAGKPAINLNLKNIGFRTTSVGFSGTAIVLGSICGGSIDDVHIEYLNDANYYQTIALTYGADSVGLSIPDTFGENINIGRIFISGFNTSMSVGADWITADYINLNGFGKRGLELYGSSLNFQANVVHTGNQGGVDIYLNTSKPVQIGILQSEWNSGLTGQTTHTHLFYTDATPPSRLVAGYNIISPTDPAEVLYSTDYESTNVAFTNEPKTHLQYNLASTLTVHNNELTIVPFDQGGYDELGEWNATTYAFEAAYRGWYMVSATVVPSGDMATFYTIIRANTTATYKYQSLNGGTAVAKIFLSAGQTIQICVYQSTGGDVTVAGSAYVSGTVQTRVDIDRID